MNAFKEWETETVSVFDKIISDTYTQDTENKYKGTVKCDIQPYSGELLNKEYGLNLECKLRLYTSDCSLINTGSLILWRDKNFTVIYTEIWEFGIMAVLKEEI